MRYLILYILTISCGLNQDVNIRSTDEKLSEESLGQMAESQDTTTISKDSKILETSPAKEITEFAENKVSIFLNEEGFSYEIFKTDLENCQYSAACLPVMLKYTSLDEFKVAFPKGHLCFWLGSDAVAIVDEENLSPFSNLTKFSATKLKSTDCRTDVKNLSDDFYNSLNSEESAVFYLEI